MKKYTDIFAEDLEMPGIVRQKMEDAFIQIKMHHKKNIVDAGDLNRKSGRKLKFFRNQAAVIVSICILAAGGITAYAAYHHYWSRGMQGALQATDVQQQTLVDDGIATIFNKTNSYKELAVTDEGVTVIPEMVVVNEKMVYISLTVDGYTLEEGKEPCFEYVDVYLGDDSASQDGWLNMGASFYNGIISAEDGTNMYDDGSPLIIDEKGRLEEHYTDEEGKMEYIIVAIVSEPEDSLLGKTLHVNLTNLGTVYKTDYFEDIEGEWFYTFDLPDTSSMNMLPIGKEIKGTAFVLDTIEISPVSIKVNYTVTGAVNKDKYKNGVPKFLGVVLKDGTRLPYMSDGGVSGYMDDLSKAYDISAFDRVIELGKVSAILLRTDAEEVVEVNICE